MVWVDATLQAVLDARCLVNMARELEHDEDAPALEEEISLLTKLVNDRLWSEEDAFYFDEWRNGQKSGVKSVAAYWALLAGVVPKERMERFVSHLERAGIQAAQPRAHAVGGQSRLRSPRRLLARRCMGAHQLYDPARP